MDKKPFMIIILSLLLIQPIIAGTSMPIAMEVLENTNVVAQGFRLDPIELEEHVPILINGTEDFISQGWDGSGTSGDPYLISGLNITRDVDQICIDIINTTAYFKIVDCYIRQESVIDAVRFLNTTHGTIEYCAIYGQDTTDNTFQGVYLENANNTLIQHNIVQGRDGMGLYSINSYHLESYDNLFNSTTFRAFRVDSSEHLTLDGCEFYNFWFGGYWCVRIFEVNYTTVTNCEFYSDSGESGIAFSNCYDCSVSNLYIWGPDTSEGFDAQLCPEISITNITVEYAQKGVEIADSPGFSFIDGHILDSTVQGLYIDTCANSTVEHIEIMNTDGQGIDVDSSSNTTFNDIVVDDSSSHGIDCDSSDLLRFNNISISSCESDAFYATTCHNGSITYSEIHEATDSGIYISTGANWTISNNVVANTDDYAIYQYDGDNTICTDNIVDIGEDGIYIDDSDDALVQNNNISNTQSYAISVTGDRAIISNNYIIDGYNGLSLGSSVNQTIFGNTIGVDGWYGISLYNLDTSTIQENIISNSPYYGIQIGSYCEELQILDNALTDCGFYFQPAAGTTTPLSYTYFNQTFSGNEVNGMELYYARDVENLVLDPDDYAQFILLNVSEVTIQDGEFDSVSCPIEILHSDEIDIDGVDIPGNIQGIVLGTCENVTITNTSIAGVSPWSDYRGGLYVNNIDNLAVLDCEFSRTEGFWAYFSELIFMNNCVFSDGDEGFSGYDTDNVTITYSTFLNLEEDAYYAWPGGEFVQIKHNEIRNCTRGITIQQLYNIVESNFIYETQFSGIAIYDECSVKYNEIYHAGTYGIYLHSGADFTNVSENFIESCPLGIYLYQPDDVRITNNTILYCDSHALDVYRAQNTEIYYNIFALSGAENARDRDSGTYTKNWDDGVDTGNWWDDYTPPGVYNIDGGASSVDNYPMLFLPTTPIIDHPLDIYYAEGSEGNTLTWKPFDDYLKEWELYIDGDLWDSDAWNFVDVTVDVDGLEYGEHEAEIVVYDNDQNNVTDIVMIYVFDDTPPVISNTPNTWVFTGASGQTLEWEVSDLHPENYIVMLDGEEYENGTWTTGTIEVNVDGLVEGEHDLRTVIYDIDGNSAGDTVLIRAITDDTNPEIQSPDDISYYVGETGHVISWNATDDYPAYFEVRYNGSIQVEGSWGGSRILVNVDGLSVGTHTFELTVYDGTGNNVADSVTVTVLAIEGVEPPPEPLDVMLILTVVGVAAAAVVIVVAVMFYKKKGTA